MGGSTMAAVCRFPVGSAISIFGGGGIVGGGVATGGSESRVSASVFMTGVVPLMAISAVVGGVVGRGVVESGVVVGVVLGVPVIL